MKLEDLQVMWEQDAPINVTGLIDAAASVASLHAKYLKELSDARLRYRKAENSYNTMRRAKFRYYRGEMTREELESFGWDQYRGAKLLKNEMEEFLEGDADLNSLRDRIEYHKTVMLFLEQVIKSINSRTFDIRNLIEWQKFTHGNG